MTSTRILIYLLELTGAAGLIGLIAFIPWTKLALGSVVAVIGAFFPKLSDDNAGGPEKGISTLNLWKVAVKLQGGVRFAVVIAGLVIIIGSFSDAHENYQEMEALKSQKIRLRLLTLRETAENSKATLGQSGDAHSIEKYNNDIIRIDEILSKIDEKSPRHISAMDAINKP